MVQTVNFSIIEVREGYLDGSILEEVLKHMIKLLSC